MRLRSLIAAMALFGAVAPGVASAATVAVATYGGTTNMRAGPGTNYPVIARILAGSRVNVIGCLSSFSWCDVTVQNYRGWVSTSRLEFAYASRRQTPVIGFGYDYWDRHYTNWPWYREWRRQNHRRPNWDGQLPDLQPDPRPTPVYPDPTDVYPDPVYPDQEVIYPDQGGGVYPDQGVDVIYPDQGGGVYPDQGVDVIYPDQGGGGWDGGGSQVMPDSQMGVCPPSEAGCQ